MVKLALQQPKRHPLHRDKILPWASCAPFVENSRGVLIHLPRSARQREEEADPLQAWARIHTSKHHHQVERHACVP